MAGLTDLLPKITAALTGLTVAGVPLVTILDHIPEDVLDVSELPAAILDVGGPSVELKSSATRQVTWPIDIWLLASARTTDVGVTIPAIYGLGDAVIARLDSKRTFDGLLHRTTQYADPAISVDDQHAYGVTAPIGDLVLVGTTVHALFTLDRVGGF